MKQRTTQAIVTACALTVAAANAPAFAESPANQTVSSQSPSLTDKAARESGEAAQDVSDGWISTKVKAVLIYDRKVEGTDIEVDTKNGVVTLRGQVKSASEREQAVSLAREVKGVKKVLSELSVG